MYSEKIEAYRLLNVTRATKNGTDTVDTRLVDITCRTTTSFTARMPGPLLLAKVASSRESYRGFVGAIILGLQGRAFE